MNTIALLASGGVDSAVSTHLMCAQGLRPQLFYIKIGAHDDQDFSCTMEEDLEMVHHLARQYHLDVEVVDLHTDYWERVISYLVDRTRRGLTPNPDVMCNSLIKFGCFYERVGKDFDMTVTGHYATTRVVNGIKYLTTAIDPVKDQTDFLCQITPEQLKGLHFPVGELPKAEVRCIAETYHLAPARRKDSQGICFLGNTTYNALLTKYLGQREGDIIEWGTRRKLGTHQGYWFHTVGQRKGLRLGGGPWYVVHKDIRKNRVFVCHADDFEHQTVEQFQLTAFHAIATETFTLPQPELPIWFKIRHTPTYERGTLSHDGERYVIRPERPMLGVAPGQFAVVYLPLDDQHKICLGSGEIRLPLY